MPSKSLRFSSRLNWIYPKKKFVDEIHVLHRCVFENFHFFLHTHQYCRRVCDIRRGPFMHCFQKMFACVGAFDRFRADVRVLFVSSICALMEFFYFLHWQSVLLHLSQYEGVAVTIRTFSMFQLYFVLMRRMSSTWMLCSTTIFHSGRINSKFRSRSGSNI